MADTTPTPPLGPAQDPVVQLRAWQRFHLRITALFAAVVFVVITAAALLSYQVASHRTQAALAHEMEVLAATYADGIDAGELKAAIDELDHPLRDELHH